MMATVKNSAFSNSPEMDSVLGMSTRQKVLSCMVVGFEGTSESDENVQYTAGLIREGLGGVLPFAFNVENSEQFKGLMSYFANQPTLGNFPVIRALDAEGGQVWRFNGKEGFPIIGPSKPSPDLFEEEKGWKWVNPNTGAEAYFPTPPAASIAQLSKEEAQHVCDQMAKCLWEHNINWNFAPVVDMNPDGPLCPVIGALGRSYGDTPERVTTYAEIMCDALRSKDIANCIKHYPGHGTSTGDSHHPGFHKVGEDWTPEHQKIFYGIANTDAIMTAHLFTEQDPNLPATLSKTVLDELREGAPEQVIISDDLFMGGLRNIPDPKTGDSLTLQRSTIMALAAGCDMVILSNNPAATGDPEFKRDPDFVEKIVMAVIGAIDAGELPIDMLNKAVFRNLKLRSRLL